MAVIKRTTPAPAGHAEPQSHPEPAHAHESRDYDHASSNPDDLVDSVIRESRDTSNPDPGRYEAVLTGIRSLPANDKGISIMATYTLYDGTGMRKHSVFYKMLKDDLRTPDEWGPVFYNRLMGKLGYEKNNRGADARAELTETQPAVILKITANKANPSFVNAEVECRMEDSEGDSIMEIRKHLDNSPF